MRRTTCIALTLLGAQVLPAAAIASGSLARALGLQTHLPDRRGFALTFDDGPHREGTPAILETLAELGAAATFFMTGEQVERYPELARTVADQGHAVAVHGYRHSLLTLRPPTAAAADLRRAREVVERTTGVTPSLYRPPYGVATPGILWAARHLDLRPVLWSRWARDWERRATPASVTSRATDDLGSGEILLLHDADHYAATGCWQATAAALSAIVSRAQDAGFTLQTL